MFGVERERLDNAKSKTLSKHLHIFVGMFLRKKKAGNVKCPVMQTQSACTGGIHAKVQSGRHTPGPDGRAANSITILGRGPWQAPIPLWVGVFDFYPVLLLHSRHWNRLIPGIQNTHDHIALVGVEAVIQIAG